MAAHCLLPSGSEIGVEWSGFPFDFMSDEPPKKPNKRGGQKVKRKKELWELTEQGKHSPKTKSKNSPFEIPGVREPSATSSGSYPAVKASFGFPYNEVVGSPEGGLFEGTVVSSSVRSVPKRPSSAPGVVAPKTPPKAVPLANPVERPSNLVTKVVAKVGPSAKVPLAVPPPLSAVPLVLPPPASGSPKTPPKSPPVKPKLSLPRDKFEDFPVVAPFVATGGPSGSKVGSSAVVSKAEEPKVFGNPVVEVKSNPVVKDSIIPKAGIIKAVGPKLSSFSAPLRPTGGSFPNPTSGAVCGSGNPTIRLSVDLHGVLDLGSRIEGRWETQATNSLANWIKESPYHIGNFGDKSLKRRRDAASERRRFNENFHTDLRALLTSDSDKRALNASSVTARIDNKLPLCRSLVARGVVVICVNPRLYNSARPPTDIEVVESLPRALEALRRRRLVPSVYPAWPGIFTTGSWDGR